MLHHLAALLDDPPNAGRKRSKTLDDPTFEYYCFEVLLGAVGSFGQGEQGF